MKVLLTGATGFIGSHLTERLCMVGHDVTCFIRPTSDLQWIRHLPVSYRHDLADLCQYDVIYHLAGALGRKGLPISAYIEPHINMTRRIINSMNKHTKFVYMSSAWVSCPKKSYEFTKLAGEQLLNGTHTIVRPGFVYGPGDFHHLPVFQWIEKLGRFFPIVGNGKNKVCPTYIDDVINILIKATGKEGIIPIAGEPITMNEFIWAVADAVGVPRPFIHIPIGPKKDFFATERIFPSTKKDTIPLNEGLSTTTDWYKQNNLLVKGGKQ